MALKDVILLEDIAAQRDGKPGGWGWLDKAIAGLSEVAKAFEIRRIKAIATNDQVYRAFLHRGFRDVPPIPGIDWHVTNFAKHVHLMLE